MHSSNRTATYTLTVTASATASSGLVPRSLSIIFLLCIINLFIFTESGFRPEFRRRTTQQPQDAATAPRPQAQRASSSIVRNKGWYPIEMEQNIKNNMNIGNNKRRRQLQAEPTRETLFFYLGLIKRK